jgi:Uma2 family endonuclease
MAPGSMAHTLIKSNAHLALARALRGTGCRALVDGAIVEVEGSSLVPDVVVTCSPLDFATPRVDDPIIIVEVLSPWSEKDDAGRNLTLYLKMPSLRHYLMIDQERRQIVHHERRDDLGGAFLTTIAPPSRCAWSGRGSSSRSPRSTRASRLPPGSRGWLRAAHERAAERP